MFGQPYNPASTVEPKPDVAFAEFHRPFSRGKILDDRHLLVYKELRAMDPLSIAGLTLSALEQLWKVGDVTAELVANYRDFDEASPAYMVHEAQLTLSRTARYWRPR